MATSSPSEPVGSDGSNIAGLDGGATLELSSIGTKHRIRVNGVTYINADDNTYTTGTRVGLVPLALTGWWDDFSSWT